MLGLGYEGVIQTLLQQPFPKNAHFVLIEPELNIAASTTFLQRIRRRTLLYTAFPEHWSAFIEDTWRQKHGFGTPTVEVSGKITGGLSLVLDSNAYASSKARPSHDFSETTATSDSPTSSPEPSTIALSISGTATPGVERPLVPAEEFSATEATPIETSPTEVSEINASEPEAVMQFFIEHHPDAPPTSDADAPQANDAVTPETEILPAELLESARNLEQAPEATAAALEASPETQGPSDWHHPAFEQPLYARYRKIIPTPSWMNPPFQVAFRPTR